MFLYKTRGNSAPDRKPRVYFTCHPEDFSKHFEGICEAIFKTHDCAVFYTESMSAEVEEKYKESDLGRMNLFVIPITLRLLTCPSRAMLSDFLYAKEHGIPVLPIMMEPGLDALYSKADKFGELQYLDPYSTDLTAICYEEKLKRYLDSVLISDEMARRIRKAFDAYVFLSYRKKDRHYANELMRLIHSDPELRDIAVWYDEFLTPGESFRENIEKIMRDSKLFALVVTPNILEYVNGEPNYVMAHEYPDAKATGLCILPMEMEETDKTELKLKYADIPDCISPDDRTFRERLSAALSKAAVSANNDDPEHNFLIGLAYFDGIDVEVDKKRGVDLITLAAESNLTEAMRKLYALYIDGVGVERDCRKAIAWAERIAAHCEEEYGLESEETIAALNDLAYACGQSGDYPRAVDISEKAYAIRCRAFDPEHPDTLALLNNIVGFRILLGDYKHALELSEACYTLLCQKLGEDHSATMKALRNFALASGKLGDRRKELHLLERVYEVQRACLGEAHHSTLVTMNNIAVACLHLGEDQRALEVCERLYELRCKSFGPEHPESLTALHNVACAHNKLGNTERARELFEKNYALHREVLGENHPGTLLVLSSLAALHSRLGNHERARELYEVVYDRQRRLLGEENPDTLVTLNGLASACGKQGDHLREAEILEKIQAPMCKIYGEENPNTVVVLGNLALAYSALGEHQKAVKFYEKSYELRCKLYGNADITALTLLNNLAWSEDKLGNRKRALSLQERLCELRAAALGADHPRTIQSRERLAEYRKKADMP